MRQGFRIGDVVHRHYFNGRISERGSKNVPTDSTEPVDPDLDYQALLSDLYEAGITLSVRPKPGSTTVAAVKPNFSATSRNQYPPNSSVRISSSSTPAFVSISRIAATMAGGPAT